MLANARESSGHFLEPTGAVKPQQAQGFVTVKKDSVWARGWKGTFVSHEELGEVALCF